MNTDPKAKEKSYLLQLFSIAMADSHLDEREHQYLWEIAEKMGLNHQEFEELKNRNDQIEFLIPDNSYARFRMIFDFVWLMMLDGEVDEREVEVCKSLVAQLDFSPALVDEMVGHINNHLACGILPESTFNKFEEMLMKKKAS